MINKDEVRHIAALARIGLSEEEIGKFSKDLSAVLDWIEQLKEVNIDNIEPTAHITGMADIMREDKISNFASQDKIIKLFPDKKDGYDKVKSIL